MTEQRRLAAILVADVVGYSKLMGSDEAGTLAQIAVLRTEIIEPQITRHAGRLFKAVGDGFLIEFASAVQAVICAKAIQEANGQGRLPLRIGIHVGDVVVQGDDLMGDGVNVAARVEGIAESGGIAVTRAVHEQVRDKLDLAFVDKGEIALKNIQRPVQVFVIEGATVGTQATALPLPDKPSIAVLPFQNMSGDPEQEYFADGMVEDIITELSRFQSLFVIARNSTFTYKGKSIDVRQVGRDLSVRYVLEGSTRRSGDRVRITAQLLEAETGHHIWAERFDRKLEAIFDLQEEITRSIVAAIDAKIFSVETVKIGRKRPESLAEWELLTKARGQIFEVFNPTVRSDVQSTADQILAKNPRCAEAYGMKALAETISLFVGHPSDTEATIQQAHAWAMRGRELDAWDLYAVSALGRVHLMRGQKSTAVQLFKELIDFYPNSSLAHTSLALAESRSGNGEAALLANDVALRLNPRDPLKHVLLQNKGNALLAMRSYSAAEAVFLEAITIRPRFPQANRGLVVCYVAMDRVDEAKALMKEIVKDNPTTTVTSMMQTGYSAMSIEAFRAAGMPE